MGVGISNLDEQQYYGKLHDICSANRSVKTKVTNQITLIYYLLFTRIHSHPLIIYSMCIYTMHLVSFSQASLTECYHGDLAGCR